MATHVTLGKDSGFLEHYPYIPKSFKH